MKCMVPCVGKGVQEVDVVWNYEAVQLQGHLHVVQLRPGARNGLHAPTF